MKQMILQSDSLSECPKAWQNMISHMMQVNPNEGFAEREITIKNELKKFDAEYPDYYSSRAITAKIEFATEEGYLKFLLVWG